MFRAKLTLLSLHISLACWGCAETGGREVKDTGASTRRVDAGDTSQTFDAGAPVSRETGDQCSDGIDNDGDLLADCQDALDCASDRACRPDSGPLYVDGMLACQSVGAVGELIKAPVDIVWLIDDSFSMLDDTVAVQNGMRQFAASLLSDDLDYQIVVVNEPSLVLAPAWDAAALGLDPARFHPVSVVLFNDCLGPTLTSIGMWRQFIRPDSVIHFIAVTDDNSGMQWNQFYTQMRSDLGDRDFTFHAVVSPPDMGCIGATRGGQAYWEGASATGGVQQSICAPDWNPVFTALKDSITSTAVLPCEYDIPAPPNGATFDRNLVNVEHVNGGTTTGFPRRSAASECGGDLGWHYDNIEDPTKILLCPGACDQLETQGGSVNIAFVCAIEEVF